MEIGFVQFSPRFGEKEKNIKKVMELIGEDRADLIVLPELFTTGYLFLDKVETGKYAESVSNSHTIDVFHNLSKEKNAVIVGGFAEKDGEKIYNSQFVIYEEKVAIYRKAHLFYKEKFLFDKSNSKYVIFDTGGAKLGLMICFDWMFPEMMRTLALHGADIICHSANLVMPYCQKAMITRALENRVYIITANRTGMDKRGEYEVRFTGKSQIVSPDGNIILSADETDEIFKKIDIDEALARDKRINEMNDLFSDRRTDLYKL
jgi:predicted amidohydrolase